MVDLETGHSERLPTGHAGSPRGPGARSSRRGLTKERLEAVFAEDDPQTQFELFASTLWMTGSATMSTPVRIVAEYDYHNIIFCREQNFSAEQTIAFRGITLDVFETAIVNGELDLSEAFEAFTNRVLALAGAKETSTHTSGAAPNTTTCINGMPTSTASLSSAVESGETVGSGGGGGGGDEMPEPVEACDSEGEGNGSSSTGAVFSVGDVDAITRFVARGLYRNFSLYRMCFRQEPRCCREVRQVQVETPLDLPPLHEAADPIS